MQFQKDFVKNKNPIIYVGISMIVAGLVAFYSIHPGPQFPDEIRMIKHLGTFVGLMGIGVTVAGILLYLINRNQAPEAEST